MGLHDRLSRAEQAAAPQLHLARHEESGPSPPTDPYAELKTRVHHAVIATLGAELFKQQTGQDLSERVLRAVTEHLTLDRTPLTRDERRGLVREITDDILGYGPLEPFLRDETVTEIMVNAHDRIYVERHGKLERTAAAFVDNAHLMRIIDKIVSQVGRRVDESSPMVDARLPDGSRVNAIIPPLALRGPTLTVRKFARDPYTMSDLIGFGTITGKAAQFVSASVRGKLNILISGGTGTGKTTTLNALSAFVPNDERIVTIEDAAELQLQQEHVIVLESRPPNIEGQGEVRIRELVRNALRMRPDRIIVGEVRGGETLDMLQAMNTGHEGSLTTIHANSPRDALARLETLVLTGGVDLPLRAIREQISSAFDLLIQISRLVDGSRRITHITEVLRMESDVITLQDIFAARPPDEEHNPSGGRARLLSPLKATGLKPQFLEKLSANGVVLPPSFFGSDENGEAPRPAFAPPGFRGAVCGGRCAPPPARWGGSGGAAPVGGARPAPGSPVQVAGFNAGDYPHLVVNVVTAGPVHTPPRLSENGKPVSGLTTVNLGEAKSVVIAIDTSRSMGVAGLKNAAEAASFFVHRKRADDRVSVVSFGRQAAKLADFTTSSADVDSELSGLAVDGRSGTALYDAIIESARALQSSRLSGRVIVVLTDGRDVSSNVTLEQAVNAANTVGAAVYPIGVESPDFRSGALRTLARETNGTYYGAGSSQGLEQVYSSIAAELDRTWRVGYDTTARPGDTLRLHATVPGFGSADRQVEVPAAFATPASASASGLLPKDFYSPLGTLVLAIAVGLLTLLAVLLFVQLSRGSWVKQRLAAHVGDAQRLRMRRTDRMSFLAALFRATEGILGRRKQWRVIQKMLVRGDVPLRPAEFLWLSLGCSAVAGLLFAAASAPSLLILLAMGAGCVLPLLFVSLRVRRRARAFENQLPDLLTTIAASLKAGHSFKHGLQAVVEESQPPASVELQRALTEAGLGRPMDDALAEMADRVGSENFAFAITAVTIQRQVGGSLAALFDMVSETVRNRQQFARKIRSLTAMGRMSAYTLVGIPFFIAGMISLANPTYMHPLVHTGVGHILLFLGLSMIAVGSLILKKIVSFKG